MDKDKPNYCECTNCKRFRPVCCDDYFVPVKGHPTVGGLAVNGRCFDCCHGGTNK